MLGVSLSSLRRAIKLGRIRTVYVGRFLRIPAEEIERLVADQKALSVEEASMILNISKQAIRDLINADKIKAFRLADAGPFKITKKEIERILEEGIK